MKARPAFRSPLCALTALFAFGLVSEVSAQSVSTTPVGAVKMTVLGNSDTIMSVPLERPAVLISKVTSVGPDNLTLDVSSSLVSNQFVRVAGTQPNTYYLSVASGQKSGAYYTVVSNTTSSVTLDLAGDTLSGLVQGDEVRIIPYWTMGTLFPGGSGVLGTNVHGTRPTEILFYDHTLVGVNNSPAYTYYYYTGTSPGWRRVGGGLSTVRDDDIVLHDAYFIYRQNDSSASDVTVVGSVPMKPIGTFVGTIQASVSQDNVMSYSIPIPLTLKQLNLYESGAFLGSDSHGTRTDELYVFDNSVVGKNKSPSATYYYYTGSSPGWRRVGGGLSTVRDNDVVIQPGNGFIVRKKAQSGPSSVIAKYVPTY